MASTTDFMKRLAAPLIALALGACGSPDFDAVSKEAFVASCVRSATEFSQKTRAMRPDEVAKVVLLAGGRELVTEDDRVVLRRFDPGRPPAVAGTFIRERSDIAEICGEAHAFAATLSSMSVATAVDIGLTKWMAALNEQFRTARDVRRAVNDAVAGVRQTEGRLTHLVGRLAPRAGEFRVTRRGARLVPTVVMEVVNPLDQPIQALLLSLDVRKQDGQVLASGRLTFRPAQPLGPAVTSRYLVDLAGMPEFEKLVDLREELQATVKVEDVVMDNVRLLGDRVVDNADQQRAVALGILMGRITEMRDLVRRIRERVAAS
ncbi:MAG: hypothetical protein K2X45_02060 [Phreatobacter sp.]|nr:hypothetical protein [Phreatobacter sp.]